MKTLEAYLTFNGTCEEALKHYEKAFNGSITFLQRFKETDYSTPETAEKVMHAVFKGDGYTFMASDGMGEHAPKNGNNISLTLNLDDAAEQTRIFNVLAEGGTVTMPLADTFWGAHFGMVVDRYGINWMLNRELPKK
ncbi:VOC family protein [soil metagenome]